MKKTINIRWQLVLYDLILLSTVDLLLLVCSGENLSWTGITTQAAIGVITIFMARTLGNVYGQIWRYGGIQCYIRLILTDTAAFAFTYAFERMFAVEHITFARLSAIACMNLLGSLVIRMFYRYAYNCGNDTTPLGKFLLRVLKLFAGSKIVGERTLVAPPRSILQLLVRGVLA